MIKMRHGIFFQSSSPAIILAEKALPSHYIWRQLDEAVIMNDPVFAVKNRRAKARARLSDRHTCYGFFNAEGKVAYYMWITVAYEVQQLIPWELNTRLVLKPHCAYFWDCFTVSEHRRRGLYRAALHTAMVLAREQGAEKNYICCMKENVPSILAIRSSGFHDIFGFVVARLGPLVICKRSGRIFLIKYGVPAFDIVY